MHALVIGAGNIGLGFLGQLLSRSGLYSLTFVEAQSERVAVLNRERAYTVITVSPSGFTEETIQPVNAILATDRDAVVRAIVDADLVLTAVGKPNLARIAPSLAAGLAERLRHRPRAEMHMIVIACENVYDNTRYLEELILGELLEEDRSAIKDLVSFPCCMVDRIVPVTPAEIVKKYPLAVAVEDFFQFAVDGTALKAPFPPIPGIEVSDHLPAKLTQKLFTLNTSHGIIAYWGALAGYEFVHEAVGDPWISTLVQGALREIGPVLLRRYPESITPEAQQRYGETILKRFRNAYLKDTIARIASQPMRKLGGEERLVKPARFVLADGRIPAHLATGIAAAFRYSDAGDKEAVALSERIKSDGISSVLQDIAGLKPKHRLAQLVQADYTLSSLR